MEFINFIEIKDYRIRLTTQALSYCNKEYTKFNARTVTETKLRRITKAKLEAYTSSLIIEKNNKNLEDKNIYKYSELGYVVIQSSDKETIKCYLSKLTLAKELMYWSAKNTLDKATEDYLTENPILDENYKVLVLDKEKAEIKIESSVYANYKEDIDGIFKSERIVKEDGHKVASAVTIEYEIILI